MSEPNLSDSTDSKNYTPTLESQSPKKKLLHRLMRRKRWVALAGLAVLCGVIVLVAWTFTEEEGLAGGPTATVRRGPMVISITESGEIESERQKVISNELRWTVTILEVVPEGTLVKEDQQIIKFECKELMDSIDEEELKLTTATNDHTQARHNLDLKKKEMENHVLKARRASTEAEEDKKKYFEHEYNILKYEKDSAVTFAKEDLRLAEATLAFMEKINKKKGLEGTYSQKEIDTNTLSVDRLKNALKKSKLEKEKLRLFDDPRKRRELDEKVDDSKLALERAELESKRQVLIATSDMLSKKHHLDSRQKKLDELREDEKKLIVKAEKTGLVVYTANRGRRRNSDVIIAKGEKINPRQQLMIIPDMSTLQIKTKVYEALIDKVKKGIPVVVRLDSKPEMSFQGKIHKVAVLPDSQHRWLNPNLKAFNIIIKFDKIPAGLKPGMTCKVEMILKKLENVLSVPIAAVFAEQQEKLCYLDDDGKPEPVKVKIGGMNDRRVEIVSGLTEGQKVFLIRPGEEASQQESADTSRGKSKRGGPGS